MSDVRVITNNKPRPVLGAWELSLDERDGFDYLDWGAIDLGEDSASFFRYRGSLYDLGEFSTAYGILKDTGLPAHLASWHGYMSESAFSAIVVRYTDDMESVVVGLVLS